jgi:hypothetical protein
LLRHEDFRRVLRFTSRYGELHIIYTAFTRRKALHTSDKMTCRKSSNCAFSKAVKLNKHIYRLLAGGETWFEQHLKNSSGHGCPLDLSRQSENFCRSEDFPRRGKSSGAARTSLGRTRVDVIKEPAVRDGTRQGGRVDILPLHFTQLIRIETGSERIQWCG